MSVNLDLMDYAGTMCDTGIDMYDTSIKAIFIEVISGDEVASIIRADGATEYFDASPHRIMDYNDGSYPLFIEGVVDHRELFATRKTSYDMFDLIDEGDA